MQSHQNVILKTGVSGLTVCVRLPYLYAETWWENVLYLTQYQKIRCVAVCCFSGKRIQLTEFTRIYAYILSSLNPSFFIEMPVPSQESERSCICVSGVTCLCVRAIDFASIYDFDIWFWNFSDSEVFCFHFISLPACISGIIYLWIVKSSLQTRFKPR